MKYYYNNSDEYNFFEENRFNNSHLPFGADIQFMAKNIDFIRKANIDKGKKIPIEIYNKLKPIIYFDNSTKIDANSEKISLRKYAMLKQPLLKKYTDAGIIVPFEKLIYKHGNSLLEATKNINIENFSSLYEYIAKGEVIGNCGDAARLFYSLYNDDIYDSEIHSKGYASFLAGSKNSIDGIHAWLEARIFGERYILDTSTLLAIPTTLKEKLGYIDSKIEKKNEIIASDYKDSLVLYTKILNDKFSVKNKASYVQYYDYIRELSKEER